VSLTAFELASIRGHLMARRDKSSKSAPCGLDILPPRLQQVMSVEHKWLILVLLTALMLRLGAAVVLQGWLNQRVPIPVCVIPGDATGYWYLGQQIADGKKYEMYSPPRQVLRMPGFPAFLAVTHLIFSGSPLGTRVSLCLVGTVACGLVYCLGRELADARTGLIASALAAVSPAMIAFTPLILSETLFAVCLLLSLLAMARLVRAASCGEQTSLPPRATIGMRRSLLALLTGALVGVACHVRPSWLLAGPLFAATLPFVTSRRWMAVVQGALVVLGLLAVLLPWGLRNQLVTGHFVLTTLWVGPSLYDGLNPHATGDSDMTFFDQDNLMGGRHLSEYEMDQHYRRAAWDFVTQNPGRVCALALIKLRRYWNPWPNAAQFDHWSIRLVLGGSYVVMMLCAAIGGWRERKRFWMLALTAGPILYFAAIHTVFVSSLRYRLPAEYPLLILSAAGVRTLLAWRRGPRLVEIPSAAA
jgi:4-amino-4-deoxy-L-arabinose transferase-like glycosyltransferase